MSSQPHGTLVALGLATVLAGCASASGPPAASRATPWRTPSWRSAPPLSREAAIEVLETTPTFAGTSVGFGGEPSREACAFGVVLRQPDAADVFKALLARAETAGQLYGLCGLYLADPVAFKDAVEPYRRRTDSVRTLFGCVGGGDEVRRIVEYTGNLPVVRLASPAESMRSWLARNPGVQSFAQDILGGGYPSAFGALRSCGGR